MIILYWKDQPQINDCRFNMAISDLFSLIESGNKLYMEGQEKPVINDTSKVGWFAVPEQHLPAEDFEQDETGTMNPIPCTVGELNLHYDWPEGFIPLPGTGIPEKLKHIENFLTKMFPTRGI